MQLTLSFDPVHAECYDTCREFVASRVHLQGKAQKVIAADMGYSPSDLSRKLAQNPDDSRRFTLDDLEKFMETTGDHTPVHYLVEKFITDGRGEIELLERRLAELKSQKGPARVERKSTDRRKRA